MQAATDTDTHVFRVRVLQAFLASGTPLNRLRFFRPVLERDGLKLTDASHMAQYIPLVEEREYKLLKMELHSHFLGIAFDGTSRLGEAVNVVGRFCTDKFEIVHRLLRFLTTKLHMKGSEFATMITRVVVLELGIDPALLVNIARDSVAVNGAVGAAARILLESPFSCAENQLCIAHTLNNVGGALSFDTLQEFMTPWLELVGGRNPNRGAQALWRSTVSPTVVPGYSKTR